MVLLGFSVAVVMATLFIKDNRAYTAPYNIPPGGAFVLFWFLIIWLAMMEGGQGALVGLQPVDKSLYATTHPRTLKNTKLSHKGDNMERFIIGRQFLVVLVIFIINICGSAREEGVDPLGLPKIVNAIFIDNGLAMVITTIVIGQLTAQVNAAVCLLDFINNYFMLFTVYCALFIEFTGLLHSVYLVQMFFALITRQPVQSNEPPRSLVMKLFFWFRVLMSVVILGFCLAITMKALVDGNSGMWDGVPPAASIVIFFLLMCVVGMMEGMQIAAFALLKLPEEDLKHHSLAYKNCMLMFSGQNLQAFLIGRQIFVALLMFIVARIASIDIKDGDPTIFGVPQGFQSLMNTGLLGAVVLTIIGSLAWRIVASSFPIAFMSNPLIYVIIRICHIIEASGVCSASWVLARWHKFIINYQPDDVYLEGAERHTTEPVTRRDRDIDRTITVVRYVYSFALLVFSIIYVMATIFNKDSKAAVAPYNIPPGGAFVLFWFLIIWLAMMEGGQGDLVGLQVVDKELYAKSHPRTLRNTKLAHWGDNMERFIVGRQFLVCLVIFVINICGSPKEEGVSPLGLPQSINSVFIDNGFAMIMTTIVVGQLTSQVNAAVCMLDFINNYFMLFTVYVALFIEYSGLLHSVYLVQIIFSKIAKKPIESKEPPRNIIKSIFFWFRVLESLVILSFALAVTIKAILDGDSGIWQGTPVGLAIFVFFLLMCVVGLMEGMQIAAFALVKLPDEQLKTYTFAYKSCTLMFSGQNFQAFLIGRQIFVASLMFIVARIASLSMQEDHGNIFGVSDSFQGFLNTGLLGAVILTIIGSLAWRIVASSFPVAFMSNPIILILIRICLLIEASGICSSAWVLARWHKLIINYQPDEVYLKGAPKQGAEPVTKRDKDVDITVTLVKYLYSLALLTFAICIIMAVIFTENTTIAKEVHPVFAFFLFWFFIIWLAMMEGGQGALVGLQVVDPAKYKATHPRTFKNTKISHWGDNMERFILGRQYLVVLIIFLINQSGAPIDGTVSVLNLPKIVTSIFLENGVANMIVTIIMGQLTSQVNAAVCMIDFLNNYFMLFTIYVSLFIEFTGLVHSVYLVQIFFSKITGKPIESKEPPRSFLKNIWFWFRVLESLLILSFALAVTIKAILDGNSGIWKGTPPGLAIFVFFLLMCIVGLMEGMQIAAFALVKLPDETLQTYGFAYKNCKLMFSGTNFQAFLIGRQIFVAALMFIVAKIATVSLKVGDTNIFGVSDGFQRFINTGLLGSVILTIIGSLAWRIIASSFPVAFMSNPLIYVILRITLFLDTIGIASASWLLALINKQVVNYRRDEEHVGHLKADDLALEEEADAKA